MNPKTMMKRANNSRDMSMMFGNVDEAREMLMIFARYVDNPKESALSSRITRELLDDIRAICR